MYLNIKAPDQSVKARGDEYLPQYSKPTHGLRMTGDNVNPLPCLRCAWVSGRHYHGNDSDPTHLDFEDLDSTISTASEQPVIIHLVTEEQTT